MTTVNAFLSTSTSSLRDAECSVPGDGFLRTPVMLGARAYRMTRRIPPAPMLCCLVLSCMPVAAAYAVETADAPAAESAPAQAEHTESAATESAETQVPGRYGIFSTMFDFIRGLGANAEPESESESELESELESSPDRDPEPARNADAPRVTYSHVHQATMDLIAEIVLLRKAVHVTDAPREARIGSNLAPVHAYVKSLEVLDKTIRVQRRLGMIPVERGAIPARDITSADVHRTVLIVIDELGRVKRQLVVKEAIEPTPLTGGVAPSVVYKRLGDASFLLDGLVGRAMSSNDVYMRILQLHDELALIARKLKIALEIEPPPVDGAKVSRDTAQQILRATYKLVNLQSRLGMGASNVPNSAIEQVAPSDVYDATNHLLAELMRLKAYLGIRAPPVERRASSNRQPEEVFAQAQLLVRNLEVLTRAASGAP